MGSRSSKANVPRCWCCGTRYVDKASLLSKRSGPFLLKRKPTGEMVCPHGCPPKEEYDRLKSEYEGTWPEMPNPHPDDPELELGRKF